MLKATQGSVFVFRVRSTAVWPAQIVGYLLGATALLLLLPDALGVKAIAFSTWPGQRDQG